MTRTDSALRRYDLPSVRHEGWAIVVIDDAGYFSAVSDYGNYAYYWGAMGVRTLREFLASCDGSYVLGKISPGYEFDERETERAARELVCRERKARRLTADEAREAYDSISISNAVDLYDWIGRYPGDLPEDYYEVYRTMRNPQAVAFVERVLPRLQEILRAELATERAA